MPRALVLKGSSCRQVKERVAPSSLVGAVITAITAATTASRCTCATRGSTGATGERAVWVGRVATLGCQRPLAGTWVAVCGAFPSANSIACFVLVANHNISSGDRGSSRCCLGAAGCPCPFGFCLAHHSFMDTSTTRGKGRLGCEAWVE